MTKKPEFEMLSKTVKYRVKQAEIWDHINRN